MRTGSEVPIELGAVVCPSGETRLYGRFELSPKTGERLASLPCAAFAAGALVGAAVALYYVTAAEGEAGGEDDNQDGIADLLGEPEDVDDDDEDDDNPGGK